MIKPVQRYAPDGALLVVAVVQRIALAGGALLMASLTFAVLYAGNMTFWRNNSVTSWSILSYRQRWAWDRFSADALWHRRSGKGT